MKLFGKFVLAIFAVCMFASLASAGGLDVNTFNYEPAPASPGASFDLWVHVKNDNYAEADEALFEIEVDYPFSIGSQSSTVDLGVMKPYQISVVRYTVNVDPTVSDGTYKLYAKVGHEKKIDKKVPIDITINTEKPVIEMIEGSVIRAAPGDEASAKFLIKNIGSSIASDIIVKIEEDRTVTSTGVVVEREILPLGSSSQYIESLAAGEKKEISMLVSVDNDADLKTYTVPVTINYFDRDRNSLSTTSYLGVKVTAEPELDSVISDGSAGIPSVGTSDMRINLFNVGVATAKFVVVSMESDVLNIHEPKQFIGTLEADDFDSFNSAVSVEPGTPPGEYAIDLEVTYKDQENKDKVKQIPLTFNVVAGASGEDSGLAGLFNLVFLIVVLLVVWFILGKVLPIPGPGVLLKIVKKRP